MHDAAGQRIVEYLYDELNGTSSLIREYIWAGGMNVAVVENGALYYVRTDHIGRPVFATDDSGAKVWEATYLPFGGVHTSSGPNSDLRFPGQWFQSETGLHQNWMRDYDPTLGRYLQADPLGLVDGASVYGYALQSPGRYIDPRGEAVILVCRPLDVSGGKYMNAFSAGVAEHCATFVVQDENNCFYDNDVDPDGVVAQFSLSSPNTTFDGNAGVGFGAYQADRITSGRGTQYGFNRQYVIPVPQGQSACEFDRNVKAAGENYLQGPYKNFGFGGYQNSNTAAFSIIRQAGGVPPNLSALHSRRKPSINRED